MSNLVKTVSDDSFQADVVQSATPVLVDFWAPWCGPCKAIAPILEELASTYQGKLQIAKISVDDNQEVPASFGIRNIPTLILFKDGSCQVSDDGRGMPVDIHPEEKISGVELILTRLHAGGKFSNRNYTFSGGLHGVGSSVVNALSEKLEVEVARDRKLYGQNFARGIPLGPLVEKGAAPNRRGTSVVFRPDPEIFGARAAFKPARLFKMARA